MAPPMTQPINALDEVMPCIHLVITGNPVAGEEKGFKPLFGTGNHCRVVAEQQSTQDGYGGNGVQIQSVSFLCQVHDDSFDVKLINFIMLVRVERLAHAVQLVVQLTVEFVVPRGPVGYAGLEFLQRKHIFHFGQSVCGNCERRISGHISSHKVCGARLL